MNAGMKQLNLRKFKGATQPQNNDGRVTIHVVCLNEKTFLSWNPLMQIKKSLSETLV